MHSTFTASMRACMFCSEACANSIPGYVDVKWPAARLRITNLHELEQQFLTSKELSDMVMGYYASGADDERTLHDNLVSYERWRLLPRMLRDVSGVDTSTTLFGKRLSFPVLVAPMAMQQMAHKEGEQGVARACAACGTNMIVSTMGNYSIKQVAQSVDMSQSHLWFQLYVFKNRETVKTLVQEAKRLGYKVLVVTVDAPRLGNREADARNSFTLPDGLTLGNATYAADAHARERDPDSDDSKGSGSVDDKSRGSGIAEVFVNDIDASLTWELIPLLRSITSLPILVKGVLHPEDAKIAVDCGASGVVVSNHGGRQLDTVPAPIDVLPAIRAAVGARVPVLLDGGIRRGTDVLKALALGADAVCIGRPILYALARAGRAGVQEALELLRWELTLNLALVGCASVSQLTADCVRHVRDLPLRSML